MELCRASAVEHAARARNDKNVDFIANHHFLEKVGLVRRVRFGKALTNVCFIGERTIQVPIISFRLLSMFGESIIGGGELGRDLFVMLVNRARESLIIMGSSVAGFYTRRAI